MDFPKKDFEQERLQKLRELFPEVFSEQKLDLERLWEIVSQDYLIEREHYELTWVGKKEARFQVRQPSQLILQPQKSQSIDFENAKNLLLIGDNLEVLKILQKSYVQKVKMIYIDPPYNTGSYNFVYQDNFQKNKSIYERKKDTKNIENELNIENFWQRNSQESGRFHSNWLSMMYPRIALARPLLSEDGVIFISIDDHELYNLRLLLDEIFGEENFVGNFVWVNRTTPNDPKLRFATDHEYILVYAKNINFCNFQGAKKDLSKYKNPDNDPNGAWFNDNPTAPSGSASYLYPIENPFTGEVYFPPKGRYWAFAPNRVKEWTLSGKLLFPKEKGKNFLLKKYLSELKSELKPISSVIQGILTSRGTKELKSLFDDASPFKYPKPTPLLKLLISQVTDNEDIILDFFAGSASIAHAVIDLNIEQNTHRQFICVQIPEKYESENKELNKKYQTVAQVTQQRIQKVIEKHRLLGNNHKCLSFRMFELTKPILAYLKKEVVENYSHQNIAQIIHQNIENVIFEWLLEMGLSIDEKMEKVQIAKDFVYIIYLSENKSKIAFLLTNFTEKTEKFILKLKPYCIVYEDFIFKNNDSIKSDFFSKLNAKGILYKKLINI
ncbi:MAG: site-specific DNA-methyltransferase [Flammeovirgaceae bacterium]